MYLFLIPLLLGFAGAWASAFTAFFTRLWGVKGGQMATMVLRNLIGIPLLIWGYVLAWRADSARLLAESAAVTTAAWTLIGIGSIPIIWGHVALGLRTHMPSVKDTLVTHGLYAHLRHPIYAGGFPFLAGLFLLHPTRPFLAASLAGIIGFLVQARCEEIDLIQRLPAYRDYMKKVPRFIPRLTVK